MIKWAYARTMLNLYPSLPGNLSLSISHRERGTNKEWDEGPDADLLRGLGAQDGTRGWWDAALPPTRDLPWYDMCFHQMASLAPSRTEEEFAGLASRIQLVSNLVVD